MVALRVSVTSSHPGLRQAPLLIVHVIRLTLLYLALLFALASSPIYRSSRHLACACIPNENVIQHRGDGICDSGRSECCFRQWGTGIALRDVVVPNIPLLNFWPLKPGPRSQTQKDTHV